MAAIEDRIQKRVVGQTVNEVSLAPGERGVLMLTLNFEDGTYLEVYPWRIEDWERVRP